MKRRDALQRVAIMMGSALSAPTLIAVLEGCKSTGSTEASTAFALSPDYKNLVAEIAELIIPKTSTPGAKDAGVGPFIEIMLKDCYTKEQQDYFIKGLDALEEESKKSYSENFLKIKPEQQTELLKKFEKMASDEAKLNAGAKKQVDAETGLTKDTKKKDQPLVPFFKLAKELTLLGYFTSEAGATKALNYLPVPGKYEGCVKLEPGQKAWAL